jgi:quinone-modifying oxidoreductase subunit QmoB
MASLKHAKYVHEQNPDAPVYIIYKDMRTPGQYERFYRRQSSVHLPHQGRQRVGAGGRRTAGDEADSPLGDQIDSATQVLATGMVPNAADGVPPRCQ